MRHPPLSSSQVWAVEDGVPYKAAACEAWHRACNPDENPIECWHWCHWDALQRTPGSVGSADKGGTGGKGGKGGEVGGGWQAGPY